MSTSASKGASKLTAASFQSAFPFNPKAATPVMANSAGRGFEPAIGNAANRSREMNAAEANGVMAVDSLADCIDNDPVWLIRGRSGSAAEYRVLLEAFEGPEREFYGSRIFFDWYYLGWRAVRNYPDPLAALEHLSMWLTRSTAERTEFFAELIQEDRAEAAAGDVVSAEPLSLTQTVDPRTLTDAALHQEVGRVREWLAASSSKGPIADRLYADLEQLRREATDRLSLATGAHTGDYSGLQPRWVEGQIAQAGQGWFTRWLDRGHAIAWIDAAPILQGFMDAAAEGADYYEDQLPIFFDSNRGFYVQSTEYGLRGGERVLTLERWFLLPTDSRDADLMVHLKKTSQTVGLSDVLPGSNALSTAIGRSPSAANVRATKTAVKPPKVTVKKGARLRSWSAAALIGLRRGSPGRIGGGSPDAVTFVKQQPKLEGGAAAVRHVAPQPSPGSVAKAAVAPPTAAPSNGAVAAQPRGSSPSPAAMTTAPSPLATPASAVLPAAAAALDPVHRAQKAFFGTFAQDAALSAVWMQAAIGAKDFPAARAEFWRLINAGVGAHVSEVRAVLDIAGYDLQGGERAPLLRMSGWDARPSRELADRLLTIDHKAAQSKHGQLTLDAANLMFLSGRDNSSRGNRFTAIDDPVAGGGWEQYRIDREKRPVSKAQKEWEAKLRDWMKAHADK